MIILPAASLDTAQDFCAGVPTKILANARWTRWTIAKERRWLFCKPLRFSRVQELLNCSFRSAKIGRFQCFAAVETRDARAVQVSFHDYRMDVALSAHGRCVAKKFRHRANRCFDIRLCLSLRLELFLFTKRDC